MPHTYVIALFTLAVPTTTICAWGEWRIERRRTRETTAADVSRETSPPKDLR